MTRFTLTYMRVFLTKNTCAQRRVNQNKHTEKKKNHLRLTWYFSGWAKVQFVRSSGAIRGAWLSHLIVKINVGLPCGHQTRSTTSFLLTALVIKERTLAIRMRTQCQLVLGTPYGPSGSVQPDG